MSFQITSGFGKNVFQYWKNIKPVFVVYQKVHYASFYKLDNQCDKKS